MKRRTEARLAAAAASSNSPANASPEEPVSVPSTQAAAAVVSLAQPAVDAAASGAAPVAQAGADPAAHASAALAALASAVPAAQVSVIPMTHAGVAQAGADPAAHASAAPAALASAVPAAQVSVIPVTHAALPKQAQFQRLTPALPQPPSQVLSQQSKVHNRKEPYQKVRVLRWTEDVNSLWSDHSGESAGSQRSTPVRLQLVAATRKEREALVRWFNNEPRTRHGRMQLYAATVANLQDLKGQVSSREYSCMLRHGALRHNGGLLVRHFAGINFERARALEPDEYPAQGNRFAVLPDASSTVEEVLAPVVKTPRDSRTAQPGLPEDDSSSSNSGSSLSGRSVSPRRERRYNSSNSGSEGRSGGRRRLKKNKKSKKSKKQRRLTAEEKGKAVAVKEDHPLTPEMAVKTLLKDKALRDQALECLPEERQLAIAKAVAAGENVCWEQEGWEAMMAAQRSGTEEATTIAAKYSGLAVSYGHSKNHRVRETLLSPVMQLIGALAHLPLISTPEVTTPQAQPRNNGDQQPPPDPDPPSRRDAPEQERGPPPRRDAPKQERGPPLRSETDPARLKQTRLKGLEAEDRLLNTLRKLRERITTYTCPLDQTTGEKSSGHLLQPLKLLMRELQDYFKEPQVKRALATKKVSEDNEGSEGTVTTVSEELIIRDRMEGTVQGLLNQKVFTGQMNTLDNLIGTLARSCISDAHLSILPSMLSRSRQAAGRNAGRNARTFHHSLMEAFELLESLHKHGVTGPVSRASLPGIFLSGLTPELHARVHKELLGKVDFHQATEPAGWEAELLRKYVEQATLEERRDPTGLKATRDQSPFPMAALFECLDKHMEQCYALPTTPTEVEGRQLPGSSTYTGCRKCKSKEHLAKDCPQQHDQQKRVAWVKCIWEEAFETLENAGASVELMEETLAVIAHERGSDFGEGEAAGASSSPGRKA
ncbi:hypothetical protein CYMTET_21740 [Cymbomonas tetramitiformis]|uniref:CCHC-type domain-containing protein n=1 Tax=Cymbomonas tetramitiformis TaxID=36881 RepID=A0AAE0G1Z0_9CHLO|nr:hypothetical protein CYMTET_21740 [Cymbomonas tetramitiformis]